MRYAVAVRIAAAAISVAALAPAAAQAQDACPNAQFRTGASAGLPDCRAWEQVSPVDKPGASVDPEVQPYSDASGDRLFFGSTGLVTPTEGAPKYRGFSAARGASWLTQATDAPSAPATTFGGQTTLAASDDGTKAVVVSSEALAPGAIADGSNLYVRDLTQPTAYRLLVAQPSTDLFEEAVGLPFLYAASPDLDTVVIQTGLELVPGIGRDADGNDHLYFLHDGAVTLASRLPGGSVGTVSPYVGPDALDADHVLSDDGRTLTWIPAPTDANPDFTVLRTTRGAGTVNIARQERAGDRVPPSMVLASSDADASRTVFAAPGPLTTESTPGFSAVYRYSAASGELEDLTAPLTRGLSPDVAYQSIVLNAVSPDGQVVWLTTMLPFDGFAAPEGNRLFALDTSTGRLSLVASFDFVRQGAYRFSPDGHRVAIRTTVPQTASPTQNPACVDLSNSSEDGFCPQVYSWNARTPDQPVLCVSCGPAGQPPQSARFSTTSNPTRLYGRVSRVITDDGRVFFDTPARLVAADIDAVADVYEYTPGSGHALLTAGDSGASARFATLSANGRSVFVITSQGLVPQDADGIDDAYVARVDGGLAGQQTAPAASSAAPCEGESCRAAPGPQPARPAPGTSSIAPPRSRPVPRFSVVRPSARALRRAARRGRLTLAVKVTAPGTVSAGLRGRIGGRSRSAGSATRRARRAQTLRLPLRPSAAARAKLRRTGRLSLRLTVSYSERLTRYRTTLTFRKGGAR